MNAPTNKDIIGRDSINAFARSAQAYCDVIINCNNYTTSQFILLLAESLATLYKDGFRLPNVEAITNALGPRITPEEWSKIFGCVHEKLAESVQYYKNHGTEEEYFAVVMLPDYLSDLYQDVAAALAVFKRGSDEDIRNAVWEWRFGFMGHYGRHMANAIRTVHLMLCDSLHYTDED